jgi:general secretion pathway protein F
MTDAVDVFSRLFEPILKLIIGVLIGGIVLYMQTLKLAGNMQ